MNEIEQILQQPLKPYLERRGHEFRGELSLCPFHNDTTPSFSIGHKNGHDVWYCHSCKKGGSIITYVEMRDELSKGDAIKKLKKEFGINSGPPKAVKKYNYTDEKGVLLYRIVRKKPKGFCADRKMDGIRRVLYRLPEVVKADDVWLLEGEKDVDNLCKIGITATTAPFGVSHWRPEFPPLLKGKNVRICLDVGAEQEERKRAFSILKAGAKEVKIIALPGLVKKGEDISDWIEKNAGKNPKNELEQIVNETPIFEETKEPPVKEIHQTDLGNSDLFAEQHRINTKFNFVWNKWLDYTGKRWEIDAGKITRQKAKETVRKMYVTGSEIEEKIVRISAIKHAMRSESATKITAMLELAKSEISINPDEFDVDPFLLNLKSGTFNLETFKFQAHQQEDLITKLAPVIYDPKAKCSRWEKFLKEIMEENENLIEFLQKAIGYSLSGSTKEQCFFILYGTGANGKTTFLQTIISMLGDYAQQSPPEAILLRRSGTIPNDIARLRGARFVSTTEIEGGRKMAESLIKSLTGSDTIVARFLFSEFFEFIPEFKLFIGTNHKPVIRGTDLAIWRRIRMIPFNRTFAEDEQDKNLADELKTELPGILNWALKGFHKWQNDGLKAPEEVKTATEEYRIESDTLLQFLEDNIVEDKNEMVKASDLYQNYLWWCEENGEKHIKNTLFGAAILEKGFDRIRKKDGKYYIGMKINRGNGEK